MVSDSRNIRILSWNIHKGVGGVDRRYDLGRVLEVIAHYAPDVMLLQEVAQGMPALNGEDQVQRLSEHSGFHAAFHPEHQFRRGGYGNLILSRWPLTDVQRVDLKVGWRKQRGVVLARAHVTIGTHHRSLLLANMHLGLAGSERALQLQRFFESKPFGGVHHQTPLVVGGDLNDLWGTLGPRFFEPLGFARAGGLRATFPAAMPLRPLDGIFYRGDLHLTYADLGRTGGARAASDHLPLYADVSITTTAETRRESSPASVRARSDGETTRG